MSLDTIPLIKKIIIIIIIIVIHSIHNIIIYHRVFQLYIMRLDGFNNDDTFKDK